MIGKWLLKLRDKLRGYTDADMANLWEKRLLRKTPGTLTKLTQGEYNAWKTLGRPHL